MAPQQERIVVQEGTVRAPNKEQAEISFCRNLFLQISCREPRNGRTNQTTHEQTENVPGHTRNQNRACAPSLPFRASVRPLRSRPPSHITQQRTARSSRETKSPRLMSLFTLLPPSSNPPPSTSRARLPPAAPAPPRPLRRFSDLTSLLLSPPLPPLQPPPQPLSPPVRLDSVYAPVGEAPRMSCRAFPGGGTDRMDGRCMKKLIVGCE